MADAMFLDEKQADSGGDEKLSGQKLVIAVAIILAVVFGLIYFYSSSTALDFSSSEEKEEPTLSGVLEEWGVIDGRVGFGKVRLENGVIDETSVVFDENSKVNKGFFADRYKREKDRGMEESDFNQISRGDYVEIYFGEDRVVTKFNYLR